jgi:hypothetical protein
MLENFDVPVRCSAGHRFTAIWVPLASLKAVRLGWKRYQYCPVGAALDDGHQAGLGRSAVTGGPRAGGPRARRPDSVTGAGITRC